MQVQRQSKFLEASCNIRSEALGICLGSDCKLNLEQLSYLICTLTINSLTSNLTKLNLPIWTLDCIERESIFLTNLKYRIQYQPKTLYLVISLKSFAN